MLVLLAACVAMRGYMVFGFEANWDEFLNLAMVYDYARGDLHEPLQTVFVHLFGWVPGVSPNEVDQIVAARVLVFVLNAGTAAFIYRISRTFVSATPALVAVLCYLSCSYVFRHGTSLRTDPIAAFLLAAGLWCVAGEHLTAARALAAGVLIGLAGIVTIKSALYLPSFAVILAARIAYSRERRDAIVSSLLAVIAALATFALAYAAHRATLHDPASPLRFIARTAGSTLGDFAPAGAASYLLVSILQNPAVWALLVLGLVAAVLSLCRFEPADRFRSSILVALALPLVTLAFYRDTYPYYYTFMLAAPAVLCGLGFAWILDVKDGRYGLAAAVLVGLSLLSTFVQSVPQDPSAQRQTIAAVHAIFPQEEAYIDCCSMIASHRKRGIFMSGWGMADYYASGEPIMRSLLERDQPHYLLANRRMLELDDLGPAEFGPASSGLFEADVAVLKENFIRHWGAAYVAGKRLSFSSREPQTVEILIAGPYTLESDRPVSIGGAWVQPGGHVALAAGFVPVEVADAPAVATLRWGTDLYHPAEPPPAEPLFRGF